MANSHDGTGPRDLSQGQVAGTCPLDPTLKDYHCFRKPIRPVTHTTETQQYSSEYKTKLW